MRRAILLFVFLALLSPALAEDVSPDCITAGCVITLRQRAQFIFDDKTCAWEYIPGKASHGKVFIRGREQEFIVLRVEEHEDEEVVIAFQYTIFDLKETVATFRFHRVYLTNSKAFSINFKTPV